MIHKMATNTWYSYVEKLIQNRYLHRRQKIIAYYKDPNTGFLTHLDIVKTMRQENGQPVYEGRCINPNITAENLNIPYFIESETIEGLDPRLTSADIYIQVLDPIGGTQFSHRALKPLAELIH